MRNTTPSSTVVCQKGITLVKGGSSVVTHMQTLAGLSARAELLLGMSGLLNSRTPDINPLSHGP